MSKRWVMFAKLADGVKSSPNHAFFAGSARNRASRAASRETCTTEPYSTTSPVTRLSGDLGD